MDDGIWMNVRLEWFGGRREMNGRKIDEERRCEEW